MEVKLKLLRIKKTYFLTNKLQILFMCNDSYEASTNCYAVAAYGVVVTTGLEYIFFVSFRRRGRLSV